jgi:hypothetical protein
MALLPRNALQPQPPKLSPQLPTILTYVAVFSSQLSALVARRVVVAVIQIATQVALVMRDSGIIMTDVAPQSAPIIGEHCSRAQPQY